MFNESQLGAISHHLGPAIILAGPGSGKTTVITHRVKELLQNHNVPSEKILVVTFTKAAALNMEQRFLRLINENINCQKKVHPVTFGTFHSVFYKVLKLTYNYRGNSIISEKERMDIIKEIAIRLKIDVPSLNEFVQNISSEISNVKGNMLDINEFCSLQCHKEDFQKLYTSYNNELCLLGKMDFDDILIRCYQLFCQYPHILKRWQSTYSHILVDEFQDINKVQYEIIKLLAEPENNIFIVGDDDQSIYGFRGAKPEIMHQFLIDYPDAKEILLNINYRCCTHISNWAKNLIGNNKNRFPKDIVSINASKNISEVKQFKNQEEELHYVAKKIKQYISSGIKPEEIAILVRNNSQIPSIEDLLDSRQINSKTRIKKNSIYDNQMGKDILSYVNAALTYDTVEIWENESLISIINKPARLIGRQLLGEEGVDWDRLIREYKGCEIGDNIRKLLFDLKIIKTATPFGAVTYIRNGVGFNDYAREYGKEKKVKLTHLYSQLDKIQQDASRFKTIREWLEYIDESRESVKTDSGINIMTMHSSKGLEFKVVFIVDANQGIVPSTQIIREKEFEEERRVFYVAITRASDVLNIYGIREVLGCQRQMSMFVSEMLRINEN